MRNKKVKLKIKSNIFDEELIWPVVGILSNEYFIKVDKKSLIFELTITSRYQTVINKEDVSKLVYDQLNNQKIRSQLVKDFGKVREMIVSKALFSTEVFDDVTSVMIDNPPQDNYISDVRNIGVTFEDKYEKRKIK